MRHLFLLVAFCGCFYTGIAQSIETGLVAKYCFSGNADDALGVRHATAYGALLTADRFGTPNEAYDLDGIDDYIQMPPDIWVSGDFSFTGWIYLRSYDFYARFVEWGDGLDRSNVFFCPSRYGSAACVFTIHDCSAGSPRTYGDGPAFPMGSWVHIAIVLSGTTVRVYKDNVFWYDYTMGYTPCAVMRNECYFGKSNFPADGYLDAKIDDIRIYDRAITIAEIDEIYKLTGCAKACTAAVKILPDKLDLCKNDTATLRATGAVSYTWSPAAGLSSTVIADPVLTATVSGEYIVEGVDAAGCAGADTIAVTVHPLPVVSAVPDSIFKCPGAKVMLNASGASTYSWTPPTGLNRDNIAAPELTVTRSADHYIVQGTDRNGCKGYDTIWIAYAPEPDVRAWPKDTSACIGEKIQLHASGAKSYSWFPPTGLTDENVPEPMLVLTAGMSYVVTGTDSNGCTGKDTIRVGHYPAPVVKASVNGVFDCDGNPVWLHATGASAYSWEPAVYCDVPDSADVRVKPPHTMVFTVTGTSDKGCVGRDTVTVAYNGTTVVQVPNAFTPNGDGLNDKVRPLVFCDFTLTEFSIYNRWGERVFSTQDINVPWDGSIKGLRCDPGVFYYLLKGRNSAGEDVLQKGDITLIR